MNSSLSPLGPKHTAAAAITAKLTHVDKQSAKICVVGAGIIGQTVAYHFLKNGFTNVTVISKDPPLDTNSDVAAALWRPYDANPVEQSVEWSEESYKEYFNILYDYEKKKFQEDEKQDNPGISFQIDLEYFGSSQTEKPEWMQKADEQLDLLMKKLEQDCNSEDEITQKAASSLLKTLQSKKIRAQELEKNHPEHPTRSIAYSVVVPLIDSTLYRKWLLNQYEQLSGKHVQIKTISQLEALTSEYDVVLNCAGEGAKHLTEKARTYPIRGVVAITEMPKLPSGEVLDYCIGVEPNPDLDKGQIVINYAIIRPREAGGGDCIMGGTYERSENSLHTSKEEQLESVNGIFEKIIPLISSLEKPKTLEIKEGFRSGRHKMYTKVIQKNICGKDVLLGGALGHGGGGYSVAHGVAKRIVSKCSDFF